MTSPSMTDDSLRALRERAQWVVVEGNKPVSNDVPHSDWCLRAWNVAKDVLALLDRDAGQVPRVATTTMVHAMLAIMGSSGSQLVSDHNLVRRLWIAGHDAARAAQEQQSDATLIVPAATAGPQAGEVGDGSASDPSPSQDSDSEGLIARLRDMKIVEANGVNVWAGPMWLMPPDLRNDIADALAQQREELANWRTWGIVEISIRNPSVMDYMDHWEGRALKAEERIAELEGALRESMQIADAAMTCAGYVATVLKKQGKRVCDCGSAPQGLCCCGALAPAAAGTDK